MDGITRGDNCLMGAVRHPVNRSRDIKGSIHDDGTARALDLGFRGGTVAGSVHLELFPPLLIEAFGAGWFERGSLSILFRNPTTDGEPARAVLGLPSKRSHEQVGAWIRRHPDNLLVGEGSASIGDPAEPTFIAAKPKHFCDRSELRILADIVPGEVRQHGLTSFPLGRIADMLAAGQMADTIAWYREGSPWGAPIVPLTAAFNMLRAPVINAITAAQRGKAVGLFGAIEMRFVHGPVRPDLMYSLSSRILGVGQTDKTEFCWFDSFLDNEQGERIAELTFMTRRVKKGSDAWNENPAAQ